MSRTHLVCSAYAENDSDMHAPEERELDLELKSHPPAPRTTYYRLWSGN